MDQPATLRFNREVPIRHEVDVFVAGGGPAGVAAAVAAARRGASVFLAEMEGALGGMGTLGLVPVFMTFSDGKRDVAAGIAREIRTRLRAVQTSDVPGNGILPEALKVVYDDLAAEAGVTLRFFTRFLDVEAEAGRVRAAFLAAKSGLFAVRASVFVDATGDGDLAVRAGAPFAKGDSEGNLMPGTLCSHWTGIDWERYHRWAAEQKGRAQEAGLRRAIADGVFTYPDLHLPGIVPLGRNRGGGNIGHLYGIDHTDEASVTRAMIFGRKQVREYERYYKEYLQGFEGMELVQTGALPGIRETRRVLGDYVLDIEDFRRRASFPDEIGRYCYPVDIHPSKPDPEAYARFEKEFLTELRYGPGESYGIPFRTLTPRGLENVLTAGRCVSTDRAVLGSLRVMPGCFITGQAAGTAAAMAAREHGGRVRNVNVSALRDRLREDGAYLP